MRYAPRLGRAYPYSPLDASLHFFFLHYLFWLLPVQLTDRARLSTCSTGGPDVEAHVFGGIAQLRSLRSLSLTAHLDPDDCTPDTLRPHATCVAHLSALSALTSLKLELSDCYEHDGHSYNKQQKDGEQHGAWVEVREAHRTSLLSALRCMPQLQHLDCPTLWLRPSELPACLTALTSLTLGGLLPPPAGEGTVHAAGGSARPLAEGGALPPQLRDLVLKDSASPRALASLRLPPSFTRLEVTMLRFGTTDVTPDMRLRPEAVAAVGPAVRMAVAHRDAACGPKAVCFLGDGGDGTVLPREDSPNGHSEWIRQLRGLDVFRTLVLQGWGFVSTGDMCCLAEALPGLQGESSHVVKLFNAVRISANCAALRCAVRPHDVCAVDVVYAACLGNGAQLHDQDNASPLRGLVHLHAELYIWVCFFSLSSVPGLRPHMTQLYFLELDLTHCEDACDAVLQSVALLLLRPHPGAVQLEELVYRECPDEVDMEACDEVIMERLERDFGVTDVSLVFMDWGD